MIRRLKMKSLFSPVIKTLLYCFLLVGLGGCSFFNSFVNRTATAKPANFVVWTAELRSDSQKNSYRMILRSSVNSVSGICFLKKMDAEWRGTFMNEMGAKIFDFTVTDSKCELLNVISMMNKSYITKTVAGDLYFLFNVDNPNAPFHKRLKRFKQYEINVVEYRQKRILVKPDSVLLVNRNHNLLYGFTKILEIEPDKTNM